MWKNEKMSLNSFQDTWNVHLKHQQEPIPFIDIDLVGADKQSNAKPSREEKAHPFSQTI